MGLEVFYGCWIRLNKRGVEGGTKCVSCAFLVELPVVLDSFMADRSTRTLLDISSLLEMNNVRLVEMGLAIQVRGTWVQTHNLCQSSRSQLQHKFSAQLISTNTESPIFSSC